MTAAATMTSSRIIRLKNEAMIVVRPALAEDAPHVLALFDALDEESVYQRFFVRRRAFDLAAMKAMCATDGLDAFTCLALPEAESVVIGVAEAVRWHGSAHADVAFTVHPAWQGLGVGRALLAALHEAAQARGVWVFEADVWPTNHAMRRVLETAGAVCEAAWRDGMYHFSLTWPTTDEGA